MKTPKRIGIELFDSELQGIINASAKIFPITQEDIDTDNNAGGYEFGRVGNALYRWDIDHWTYVIADDPNIDWADVANKPTTYPPSTHTHSELHTHSNKSVIDTITQILIDGWNSAVSHISDAVRHITSEERTLWNTVSGKASSTHSHTESDISNLDKYNKSEIDTMLSSISPSSHVHDDRYYTETEVNALLNDKANSLHDHDGRYYTESEVNTLLSGKASSTHNHTESSITDLDKYTQSEVDTLLSAKSDTTHTHSDLHSHSNKAILDKIIETEPQTDYDLSQLQYIEDIRSGYTEGHTHSNLLILDTINQTSLDNWNSAVSHVSDTNKHVADAERTLWNTVSNKSDSGHTHDYAPTVHLHDERYYTEAEVDSLLTAKASSTHVHDDRYYTESEIDSKLASKADLTTLTGHTGNSTVHVTQTDKDNWNGKSKITIGLAQPTDSSLWYQETV